MCTTRPDIPVHHKSSSTTWSSAICEAHTQKVDVTCVVSSGARAKPLIPFRKLPATQCQKTSVLQQLNQACIAHLQPKNPTTTDTSPPLSTPYTMFSAALVRSRFALRPAAPALRVQKPAVARAAFSTGLRRFASHQETDAYDPHHEESFEEFTAR